MTLIWIAVGLGFAIVEVATVALFAAFLAVGALAAAAAAFAGADLLFQGVAFATVSVLGIAVARPPLLRYLRHRHAPVLLSGAPGMIGETAMVVDSIAGPHNRGHVRIAGEDWPALSRDGRPISQGASVRVVDIKQATLVVEKEV